MSPVRAAVALCALALVVGCGHVEEAAAPAGIPYACADGRTARIFFSGGDPTRAAARLLFDGREFSVVPVPSESGLRYVGEDGLSEGHSLVWWAEGDAAALSETANDPAAGEGEREIVRCSRVREGDPPPAEPTHGD